MRTSHPCFPTLRVIHFILILATLLSCSGNDIGDSQPAGKAEKVTFNVALIYPFSRDKDDNICSRTLDWILNNGKLAQKDMPRQVVINVEKYDEDNINIDSLAITLAKRDDIHAVVGPAYSNHMDRMATLLESSHKVLISPWATSADIARNYAGKDFFWSLVESDITQCEMLISRAIYYGAKKLSLITTSNTYGNTFNDWFPFQAHEMGVEIGDVYIYDGGMSDLRTMTRTALTDGSDAIICVPSRIEDAIEMIRLRDAMEGNPPLLLFSDVAHNETLLTLGKQADYIEGLTPYIAPETGFSIAYKAKFGSAPSSLEGQLYDAFLILFHAFTALDINAAETLNDAIKYVVSSTEPDGTKRTPVSCWQYEALYRQLHNIRNGKNLYDIGGATGDLNFNISMQSSVLRTTYVHWMAYNNRFISLDYLTSDGSRRTEGTMPSWNWNVENIQSFNNTQEFTYGEKNTNWAFLIATSYGWLNYRHQADVLTFYNMLKSQGYDDDHIVLVMQDDLRDNARNSTPGRVTDYYGNDLYTDGLQLDYKIKDITPEDLEDILTGKESTRLPNVLKPTKDDNILVFWSGHGEKGILNWEARSKDESFTTKKLATLLRNMRDKQCYRKMLWIIEACYSASVAIATESEEIPGVMIMTAANAYETSKSDLFRDGIYYTDRFTRIITQNLTKNPDITYRDLYYNAVKETTGSHPTIINANRFDNMYKARLSEFIKP